MRRETLVMSIMALTIGSLLGMMHIENSKNYRWYQKPEAQTYEVKLESVEGSEAYESLEVHTVVEYNDPSIPDEIERAAKKYGKQYNICPEFIEALIFNESSFKPTAISKDGSCIGLMQIKAQCHEARMKRLGVTRSDLTSVDANIRVGADYLHELFEEYEDPVIVLMTYNGDSRWQQGYTSYYASHILELSEELEIKHETK